MNRIVFRSAVALGVVALTGIAVAAGVKSRKAAEQPPARKSAAIGQPLRAQAVQTPRLKVVPRPGVTGEEKRIHESLATQLSTLMPEPDDRVAHFGWITKSPDLDFVGWHATIEDAARIDGGYRVTLAVTPQITSFGASATSLDSHHETYEIVGGTLTHVASATPPQAVPVVLTD